MKKGKKGKDGKTPTFRKRVLYKWAWGKITPKSAKKGKKSAKKGKKSAKKGKKSAKKGKKAKKSAKKAKKSAKKGKKTVKKGKTSKKGKKNGKMMWVKTSRWYWRRVGSYSRKRRVNVRYQWRWGKKLKKVGKTTYKRRILFAGKKNKYVKKKWTYTWRPTRRAYWRRIRKSKNCSWRWGKKFLRLKQVNYRKRVLFCNNKKTKKSYWRRVPKIRRSTGRLKKWRWGKKTKKVGTRTYRLRVLWTLKGRKWVKTKRSYFRRMYPAARHLHRNRRVYRWRWTKTTKKVVGKSKTVLVKGKKVVKKGKAITLTKRVLFTRFRGKWRPTQKSSFVHRTCVWNWVKELKRTQKGLFRKVVQVCKGKKTKRFLWRRISKLKRSRYTRARYTWHWGKVTKMIKKRLFRRRILMKRTSSKQWRPTKRKYFRRCNKKCSKMFGQGKKVLVKGKGKKVLVKGKGKKVLVKGKGKKVLVTSSKQVKVVVKTKKVR